MFCFSHSKSSMWKLIKYGENLLHFLNIGLLQTVSLMFLSCLEPLTCLFTVDFGTFTWWGFHPWCFSWTVSHQIVSCEHISLLLASRRPKNFIDWKPSLVRIVRFEIDFRSKKKLQKIQTFFLFLIEWFMICLYKPNGLLLHCAFSARRPRQTPTTLATVAPKWLTTRFYLLYVVF